MEQLFQRMIGAGFVGLVAVAALTGCGGPAPVPGPTSPPSDNPSSSQSSQPSSAAPTPTSAPSTPSKGGPSVVEPAKDQVSIAISIAGGQVKPNGEKIDVPQGATVVLKVTSDADDEIHAHTGGDGYELEVKARTPAVGRFVAADQGSFEVESHHLEKIIVILNVR